MSEVRAARVLYVCTGNTCRSPLAEAVARAHAAQSELPLHASSAGVAAEEGAPASADAYAVAAEVGLDLTQHRARALTRAMLLESDLVLTMSESHAERARALAPEKAASIHVLGCHAGDARGDVPDPFGRGREVYRHTLEVLRDWVARSLERYVDGAKTRGH